ncbi:hypothetical protein [Winogradskyella sp. A3E31]|uniref:hypothetical protein n=1 Tax=Winogradskyella sp. A3E31 TaxID=3349637 RepID=UPI00398B9727
MLLIIAVIGFGCSNDDSEPNPNTNFNSSDYLYFVSGKLNGDDFIYGQRIDDTTFNYQIISNIPLESATCSFSADQGLDYKLSYGSSIYPGFENEDSQPLIGINFIRFYRCSDTESSTDVFNSLFPVDDYDYAVDDNDGGTMGQIGIEYAPIANGDNYYESYGTIASSNTFKITDSQENNSFLLGDLVTQSQLIEGEFSVTLFNNDDSSDVIEITEGRFKIIVTK